MLSAAQIAEYREKGYVVPDYRLPGEVLEDIREAHTKLLARHPERPEFRDNCPALLSYDLRFLNYARDPQILDMVEQLIGPDIALWRVRVWTMFERLGFARSRGRPGLGNFRPAWVRSVSPALGSFDFEFGMRFGAIPAGFRFVLASAVLRIPPAARAGLTTGFGIPRRDASAHFGPSAPVRRLASARAGWKGRRAHRAAAALDMAGFLVGWRVRAGRLRKASRKSHELNFIIGILSIKRLAGAIPEAVIEVRRPGANWSSHNCRSDSA
jgi:hypothetical protein